MLYHNISLPKPERPGQVGIAANIILGSPKKKCDGIGICRIERATYPSLALTAECRTTKALLTAREGCLAIYFVKHTIPPCALQKQFNSGRFIVEESVELPADLTYEFKLEHPVRIEPGKYQVQNLRNHLVVSVTLTH